MTSRVNTTPDSTVVEIERRKHKLQFRATGVPSTVSKVYVKGNFDAVFGTGLRTDLNRGSDIPHEMVLNTATGLYEVEVDSLEVGETYTYMVYGEDTAPGAGAATTERPLCGKVTVKIPEISPSSSAPIAEVRTRTRNRLASALGSLVEGGSAVGAEELMSNYSDEMASVGLPGPEQEKFTIGIFCDVVAKSKKLPESIRRRFADKNDLPIDFGELESRMNGGRAEFRRKVFNRLKADKDARKALNIKSNDTAISDHHAEQIFDRIVGSYAPSQNAVKFLGRALKNYSQIPVVNSPTETAARRALLAKVQKELTPHEQGYIDKIPSSRLGAISEVALQAGAMTTAVLSGAWMPVGLGYLGVQAIKALSGVSESDAITAMRHGGMGHLKKVAAKNNFFTRMVHAKGNAFAQLKSVFSEMFLRTVPFASLHYQGRPVGEGGHGGHGDHGEGEHDEEHGDAHEEEAKTERLIKKACEKEKEAPTTEN